MYGMNGKDGKLRGPGRIRFRIVTRAALIRLGLLAIVLAGVLRMMVRMPGKSHDGPLAPLTASETALREQLCRDVVRLAGEIGERNVWRYEALCAAGAFVERSLTEAGYQCRSQVYEVEAQDCANIDVEIPGTSKPEEIVVIGAHYDSVRWCPAANDNGTGVAAMLALARAFAGSKPERTLRFVAFVNEEPPWFLTKNMGSLVYAKACKARGERVVAMLSLETIGYYTDAPGSQQYPFPFSLFYPSTGNFVGFIGNVRSRRLVRRAVKAFRAHAAFPSEGAAVPGFIPGVGWSDHWSFWQQGWPAAMVTDTAPYRYPHYHAPSDTPEKVDYDRFARVVTGLRAVVAELAGVGKAD